MLGEFISMAIVALCVISVCAYGWLPFLIYGIAKRRRGEGGKWQLIVVGVWWALLVAWFTWEIAVTSRDWMMDTALGLAVPLLATAWLPLLIWGIARWCRKKARGKWMTAGSGAWGLLVVSVVGYLMVSATRDFARYAPEAFNPAAYTGEVATVEFPYDGEGTLYMYPADGNPYRVNIPISGTNRVLIPAGDYDRAQMPVVVSAQKDGTSLTCAFQVPCSVAQGEAFVFKGGFPLTASVNAQKQRDGQVSLVFNLLDSAGNRMTLSDRKKIGFEAVTPEGKHVWRGDFEYG